MIGQNQMYILMLRIRINLTTSYPSFFMEKTKGNINDLTKGSLTLKVH